MEQSGRVISVLETEKQVNVESLPQQNLEAEPEGEVVLLVRSGSRGTSSL